jgi:hypothetical protein
VQLLTGGAGIPVTAEGTGAGFVSPDGREVVAFGQSLGHRLYSVDGGDGRVIPGLTANDEVFRWSTDGRAVLVGRINSTAVDRVNVTTGLRELLLTLAPDRPTGPATIAYGTFADDPRVYAYVSVPLSSQLFTVDGIR